METAATNPRAFAASPWAKELRATLSLAWPLILANLTQQVIQATDVLLLGRLGELELAAATLAINLSFTINVLLLGLLLASSPMMATALGRRSNAVRDVRRTFRAGFWLLVLAMPLYWLLLWNSGPIMRSLGQAPELAEAGQTFLRAYMWCTAPWLLFQLLRNFVAALERPRVVLWLSFAGIALNALLSWALIFGKLGLPALGLIGAGLGSTLTWLIVTSALVAVIQRDRLFRRFHIWGRWWRLDVERTLAMVRLGAPIGITMALEMGVFGLAAFFMGWIGAPAVAAHAIALQIAALTFMVPMGLGQAATVRVGRALGSGDPDNITRAGWAAWLVGVVFMATMALVMWVFPRQLVGIFLGPASGQEIRDLAVTFVSVAAVFQIVDGAQVIGAGMLRGLHDTRWPLIFALVGYWVVGLGIGSWLAFGENWLGLGIWIGLALGLGSVAVLILARWVLRDRLGLVPAAAPLIKKSALPDVDGRMAHNHMRGVSGTLHARVPDTVQPLAKRGYEMGFRPLHDRVLVRRVEAEEKTAGGIIIPDSAKEKPQEGEVIAVGAGARDEAGKLVPLDVKQGDRILFGKWSGTEVKIDGEDLIIMKESDILGIVENSGQVRKAA